MIDWYWYALAAAAVIGVIASFVYGKRARQKQETLLKQVCEGLGLIDLTAGEFVPHTIIFDGTWNGIFSSISYKTQPRQTEFNQPPEETIQIKTEAPYKQDFSIECLPSPSSIGHQYIIQGSIETKELLERDSQ